MTSRSDERSYFPASGWFIISTALSTTMLEIVARFRSTANMNAAGSHRASRTHVAPVTIGRMIPTSSPAIQKIGQKLMITSSRVTDMEIEPMTAPVNSMSNCVCTQPFGMPVVPPV